jgi:phosphate transport system substrate-binding protein
VARTAFALATSHRNPPGLKSTEIADLFKAEAPHWVDGTPMRIILRPRSDTDTALLGSIFPGMRAAIEQARRRLDVPVAGNDQDNADLAGRIPGSLAGVALGQVVTEKRDLRLVAIDGVDPTLANLEQGVYPYARTMGFVFPATRRAAAERFLAFVQSPRGESILRACGYLPARE